MQNFKEVDFKVIKEDYGRYLLNDRTLLKIKTTVRKIIRSVEITPTGYPNFGIDSVNIITAIVPDTLKRPPSTTPFDIRVDRPQEIPFIIQEELWQEYHTEDGFKVFVKPILTKAFRYEKYNNFGEPIYNTQIQSIINVGKIGEP